MMSSSFFFFLGGRKRIIISTTAHTTTPVGRKMSWICHSFMNYCNIPSPPLLLYFIIWNPNILIELLTTNIAHHPIIFFLISFSRRHDQEEAKKDVSWELVKRYIHFDVLSLVYSHHDHHNIVLSQKVKWKKMRRFFCFSSWLLFSFDDQSTVEYGGGMIVYVLVPLLQLLLMKCASGPGGDFIKRMVVLLLSLFHYHYETFFILF